MAYFETPAQCRARLKEAATESLIFSAMRAEATGTRPVATIKLANACLTRDASPEIVAAIGPWLEEWRSHAAPERAVLETSKKNFAIAKRIDLPKALLFETVDALARFFGMHHPARLHDLRRTLSQIAAERLPAPQTDKSWRAIYRASPADQDCLIALMRWRAGQDIRTVADTALREIPVAELHTKWIEDNRGLVLSVFLEAGWENGDTSAPLSARLGLAEADRGEVWCRLHPEQAALPGQRLKMGYAPSEFIEAPAGVKRVLIVENRTTFDTTSVSPGTCLIFGSGKAILSYAERMTWLREFTDIDYWGDCDGAGYFILSRLRRVLPQVRSIGMDLSTVEAHLVHATPEAPREAVAGPMPELDQNERSARDLLRARRLRIEQEYVRSACSTAPS